MRFALLTTFFLFILANSSAQSSELIEEPSTKFGINLGLNYSNVLTKQQLPAGVTLSNGFGFNLEMLSEHQLFKRVFAVPKIGFSFNDSKMIIVDERRDQILEYDMMPIAFDVSIHIQIKKSSPNSRPYIYAGPSMKFPIRQRDDRAMMGASLFSQAIDVGAGFDWDFGYFQLSPELRYSIGLNNVLDEAVFGDIYYHNISILFNFLG